MMCDGKFSNFLVQVEEGFVIGRSCRKDMLYGYGKAAR